MKVKIEQFPCRLSLGLVLCLISSVTPSLDANETLDLLVLYARYCGPQSLCNPDLVNFPIPVSLSQQYHNPCPRCFCDERCHQYGNCCPDVADISPSTSEIASQYMCMSESIVLSKCLENESSSDIVDRCEMKQSSMSMPVFSNATGKSYRNVACAACNGDDRSLEYWSMHMVCKGRTDYFYFSSTQTIIDKDACVVKDMEPKHYMSNFTGHCDINVNLPLAYTTCNQTGHWHQTSNAIALACASFLFPISATSGVYKNAFCYHCNPSTPHQNGQPLEKMSTTEHPPSTMMSISKVPFDVFASKEANDVEIPNGGPAVEDPGVNQSGGTSGEPTEAPRQNDENLDRLATTTSQNGHQSGNRARQTQAGVEVSTAGQERQRSQMPVTLAINTEPQAQTDPPLLGGPDPELHHAVDDIITTSGDGSQCHVSDRSKRWNQLTAWACRNMLSFGASNGHRNTFCCLCDLYDSRGFQQCVSFFETPTDEDTFSRYPFDYLFDFVSPRRKLEEEARDCGEGEFYDKFKGTCRPVICSPGRVLRGVHCVTTIKSARNLSYSFRNTYVTTASHTFEISKSKWKTVAKSLGSALAENISQSVDTEKMTQEPSNVTLLSCPNKRSEKILRQFLPHCTNPCLSTVCVSIAFVTVSINILTADNISSRDAVEEALVNLLDQSATTTYRWGSLTFLPVQLVTKHDEDEMFDREIHEEKNTPRSYCVQTFKVRTTSETTSVPGDAFIYKPIHRHLLCAQLRLSPSEFHRDANDGSVLLKATLKRLSRDRFMNAVNDSITICLDEYEQRKGVTPRIVSLSSKILRLLTLTCSGLSAVCLLLTFLTYSLFKKLRTIPGQINMCLVAILFLAKSAWFAGLEMRLTDRACVALGVSIHYLWIAAFLSMNICSFHMFRVFSGIEPLTFIGPEHPDKILCFYLGYILVMPLFIVAPTLVTNWILTDGQSLGYGGHVCFLSSTANIGFAFVLPVGVTVLINCVYFGTAATKIKTSPDRHTLPSSSCDGRDFFTCVKLFTITGVAWALQMLDSQLQITALSFASAFVNGCQGVFIFFAFICNKRVFEMYKNLLRVAHKRNALQPNGNENSTGLESNRAVEMDTLPPIRSRNE